jgi:uncharacterized protein (TIGR00661 family)
MMTILIAPLDWGLGHTTRCIAIIRLLIDNQCKVIVACNPIQKTLLKQEFTDITFIPLAGYNIQYSKTKRLLPLTLIIQLPKIVIAIIRENIFLRKILANNAVDAVISDNRYGLFTKKVASVFITHQLTIKAPYPWLEKLIQRINYSYINRFDNCWVPDYAGEMNIAGLLSHPNKIPQTPIQYLGPLSRFSKSPSEANHSFTYKYCIILSGPEPQRTILEEIILAQIASTNEKGILVRAKLDEQTDLPNHNNLTIENHLSGKDLQKAIECAEFVITRSGYTSVMELLSLEKKMILIPTPGQTEQEYLGNKLMQQQWAIVIEQDKFNLNGALETSTNFPFHFPSHNQEGLKKVITNFLESI